MSLRLSMLDSDSDSDVFSSNSIRSSSSNKRNSSQDSKITNISYSPNSRFYPNEDFNYSSSHQSLNDLKALEISFTKMEETLTQERIDLQRRKQRAQAIIRSKIDSTSDIDQASIDKMIEDTRKAENFIENNPLNFLEIELKAAKQEVQLLEQENEEKRSKLNISRGLSQSTYSSYSPSKHSTPRNPTRYNRSTNLLAQVEHLFSQTTASTKIKDTDEKILALCETVQKRNNELKEEKKRIKKMEEENQKIRNEMEKQYRVQELKLKQLQETLNTQKKLSFDLEQAKESVLDKKHELQLLEQQKEQIERQNYTVMRDRIFNKTYKRQIEDLKAAIKRKRDEISMNRKVLEAQKVNVQKLKEQVEEKERMLEKYEKRVIKMEKDVNENSINFTDTIEEAKRELDSITDPNLSRSRGSKSIINEEVAEIFNDDQEKSPKKNKPISSYNENMSKLSSLFNEETPENKNSDSSDLDPDYFEPSRVSARLSLLSPSPVSINKNQNSSLISSNYQTELMPNELSSYSPSKFQPVITQNSPYVDELASLFA